MADANILIKNPEKFGKIYTGQESQIALLCKQVAEKLHTHYPNQYWIVGRTRDFSVIYIGLAEGSMIHKYVLHTLQLQTDVDLRSVVRAGGEMLERARISRNWNAPHQTPDTFDLTGCKDRLKSTDSNKNILNLKRGTYE